ncbi:MAG: tRNA pseudouridine(13) synthase TruD [Fuerstiella sp.]
MSVPLEYLDPVRLGVPVLSAARVKTFCEDFRVEERPTYQPSGEGEHLFLWVKKQDVSAAELLRVISQQLKVNQRDIGVAGQKDRRAVTLQYVSVPASCEPKIADFHDERIQILRAKRHANKLRTGHVLGNRFLVVLRPTEEQFTATTCTAVERRLMEIAESGFPNYYGTQRFGTNSASVDLGVQLLNLSAKKRKANRASRFEKRMSISAVQSAVFNLVTSGRVANGSVNQPIDGDVVCRRGGIRPFLYSNRNADETAQLIPMGPMPGPKMVAAEGEVLIQQQNALQRLGLLDDHFSNSKTTPGARRPMLAWPTNCTCDLNDEGCLRLSFDLTAGSYATVLLREILQDTCEAEAVNIINNET